MKQNTIKLLTIIIIGLIIISTACSKTDKKKITYITTDAISEYSLQYRNQNSELIKINIYPKSAKDEWSYNYIADDGEIMYISGNYHDINSSLKIMILIDGKVYKQAANKADTLGYLIVSGTVPYN